MPVLNGIDAYILAAIDGEGYEQEAFTTPQQAFKFFARNFFKRIRVARCAGWRTGRACKLDCWLTFKLRD